MQATWVVNAAGLYSDEVDALLGHQRLHRDAAQGRADRFRQAGAVAGPALSCCQCPTSRGKGVLVAPTVFGNVLLGSTAEDVPDYSSRALVGGWARHRSSTRARGGSCPSLARRGGHCRLTPASGLRLEHGDYQIRCHREQRYVRVGRHQVDGAHGLPRESPSTSRELLAGAGLPLRPRPRAVAHGTCAPSMPYLGESGAAAVSRPRTDRGRPRVRRDRLPSASG